MRDNDEHGEIPRCLLESEILNDVLMIQVFQGLALQPQPRRLRDRVFAVVLVVPRCRGLDLFSSNYFTGGGVQRDVHLAIGALPDEFSSNPLEDRCHVIISLDDLDRSMQNTRLCSEGDSAGVGRAEEAFSTCSTVTSSTLLP